MNERILELAEQAGWMMGDEVEGFNTRLEKFAELILTECCEFIEQGHHSMVDRLSLSKHIKEYFGVEKINEDREHIGYTEREEGFYKLYAPPKGSIVTHAFILCKYCNGSIYHCMGPKYDAVCLTCYDKDPELR